MASKVLGFPCLLSDRIIKPASLSLGQVIFLLPEMLTFPGQLFMSLRLSGRRKQDLTAEIHTAAMSRNGSCYARAPSEMTWDSERPYLTSGTLSVYSNCSLSVSILFFQPLLPYGEIIVLMENWNNKIYLLGVLCDKTWFVLVPVALGENRGGEGNNSFQDEIERNAFPEQRISHWVVFQYWCLFLAEQNNYVKFQ